MQWTVYRPPRVARCSFGKPEKIDAVATRIETLRPKVSPEQVQPFESRRLGLKSEIKPGLGKRKRESLARRTTSLEGEVADFLEMISERK